MQAMHAVEAVQAMQDMRAARPMHAVQAIKAGLMQTIPRPRLIRNPTIRFKTAIRCNP